MEVTQALARFVVHSRPRDIPEPARREATRSLVNWLGCALGGSHHEAVSIAVKSLGPFAGAPQASIVGRRERFDCLNAGLINGMSAHVLDFDDTHLRTLLHSGVPIASTLVALSERMPLSGSAFLDAYVIGVDVASRLANAIYTAHNVNWYVTGTAGSLGAAAAAGKVLGLDEQRMRWAFGIAATQAAGLREMAGTMCKSFVHGRSAQIGMQAAFLAQSGFTSSERVIEAPRGFANVLAPEHRLEEITGGLGERYEILLNTYKPHACGVVVHPVIDGCIELRQAHAIEPGEVASVALRVHPLALKLAGIADPRGGLESKWSIHHSAAVALCDGMAGERQYSDERVNDALVKGLRGRVSAATDSRLRDDEAWVTVTLADGRCFERHIEHATGSSDNPLSDGALDAKFRALAEDVLPPDRIEILLGKCRSVAQLADVSEIARLAAP
jgi:2-methylcitrate dehydratase PrpD